jgi:O-acetyl-ADP-ribose deacetylase (regulator of RNase III)
MRIRVFVGDVCQAPAEVLCATTNPQFNMIAGSGAQVRKRGGPDITAACLALLEREEVRTGRRQLAPGSASATIAGTLDYHAIVHCVALDAWLQTNPETIETALRNAILTARGLPSRPRSIAVPILGADCGKYDFALALQAIAETLRQIPDSDLDAVCLVVARPEQAAAARRILTPYFGAVELEQAAVAPPGAGLFTRPPRTPPS